MEETLLDIVKHSSWNNKEKMIIRNDIGILQNLRIGSYKFVEYSDEILHSVPDCNHCNWIKVWNRLSLRFLTTFLT